MYTKIGLYLDNKHFGSKIVVYKGSKDYLLIIKDRDGLGYFFVNNEVNKIYPVNSYMEHIGFIYNIDIPDEQLNTFDIDLSVWGYSSFPKYLKEIINRFP